MYHQRKLAVGISAVLALSTLSGCSANHNVQQSSSYQNAMGDIEFQKAAHLLLKSNKPQQYKYQKRKAIKKATYQRKRAHKSRKVHQPKKAAVKFQKTAYHSTRTQTPRNTSITSDLERAAEILGLTKKPAYKQPVYRPANNQQPYRPARKNNVYSSIYTSNTERVAQELGLIPQPQQPHVTQVRHQANGGGHHAMWERIYRGQKMPNYTNHPSVRRFVKHYASDRARLNRITNRASKYLFQIVTELERRGMPTELALLPFVESAYVNTARSHAAAAGMWQFIPETGRRYGLKQRRGFDGRMDSFEATRAALDYLQKLNRQFNGDWFLSLAAYNAGEGRVDRAIKYNKRRGRPTDYWNLRLPKETREYVPRLLAYKEIIRNPRRYGIQLPRAASRPVLTSIWLNRAVDLRQAARRAGLPANTLTELNPSYLQGITTPRLSKRVILPVNIAGRVQPILRSMPTVRDSNYRYARYSKKKYSKRYKSYKKSKKRVITHRVRRGETLYKIAVRHGTTVKKIMRMNKMRSSRVKAGKRIRIASKRSSQRYS
ncbi:MAG: transglycosylase SLT domain-containing protein [Cocleimonas sp.]|nr:transglycosylase SLT domain-containing protein [Cocleimonas sp.]